MIGWSKAFWKGFVIFLWGALWAIIGVLIFFFLSISIFASVVSVISNPQDIINNPDIISQVLQDNIGPITLIIIVVGVFVGVATFASVVKVITDTVMEEVKKAQPIQTIPLPPPPPPLFPRVQQPPPAQPKDEKQT